MIRDALIFMCGAWAGVILGMVLAGFAHSSRRADDAERSELDNDQPVSGVHGTGKPGIKPPVFINTIGKE